MKHLAVIYMGNNILCIANSHAGAIARCVTTGLVMTEEHITFLLYFGKNSLLRLTYRDGQLWPTSGETISAQNRNMHPDEPLPLDAFAHIIVYGFQLVTQGDGSNWLHKLKQSNDPYSDAVRTASYLDSIRNSDHYKFLSAIKDDHIRNKILSVPTPLPNELHPGFKNIDKKSVNRQHIEQYREMVDMEISALGVKYTPLPRALLTHDQLAVQKAFKVPRKGDASHLNIKGGAILLRHILDILK